ncbi:MAG: Lrp/AsnC family transcriptional regulator [Sphingomonadales bacterium]
MQELDDFDRKLLNLIQIDNRMTADQLGDRVGLSGSAAQRRLRRLRETGVVERDVAIVAPHAVGRKLLAIVEVELEREHANIISDFKLRVQQMPEIMQCYYVTGHADFILIVSAIDMEDYDQFTQRLFTENSNIKRFHTSMVMSRVKASLAVPIDLE